MIALYLDAFSENARGTSKDQVRDAVVYLLEKQLLVAYIHIPKGDVSEEVRYKQANPLYAAQSDRHYDPRVMISGAGRDVVDRPKEYQSDPSIAGIVIYFIVYGGARIGVLHEEVVMGDKYSAGQVGAQGPNSHAHDMTFNQIWNQAQGKIDLMELAQQLSTLRAKMKEEAAGSDSHDIEIGAIAAAEQSAQGDDGPKALEHLKQGGKWALGIATSIGVPVAVEAIKRAMGS